MNKITVVEYAERWAVGGIESYILNIIKLIDKTKFNVRIVVAQKESDLYDAELNQFGVCVETILSEANDNPIKRIMKNMGLFREYLKENPCDILHLHISQGVVMSYAKIAKLIGIPKVISHCHSMNVGSENHFIKLIGHYFGKKMFHKYVDEMLACSDLASNWLYTKKDINAGKVKICKNIVDVERFKYSNEDRIRMRKEYGLENRKICLNIGRLCYQKNQLFLLDIFREIIQIDDDYRLIIIGSGELADEIHKRACEYRIEKKIVFINDTKEVEKYMSMSDLFLLPSLYEGNPIVGIEAQASGLPCFFSDSITRQAKVLESLQFISLADSATVWARKIVHNQCACNRDREQSWILVKHEGYDKYTQIKEIEEIYLFL